MNPTVEPLRLRPIEVHGPALLLSGCSVAALAIALVAQYAFGLAPCVLCVWQRWAYGAALAALGASLLVAPAARGWTLLAATAAFASGAGIAGFHVGVERKWWPGLTSCGGPSTVGDVADFLKALESAPIARCDEVAWSLFGLSMAGYNFIVMIGLALVALGAARQALARRKA